MCNREAPGVEQFAQRHRNDLAIVGIGTQDGFGEAFKFHQKYNISFPLLWDEGFETWNQLGVSSQPKAFLYSGDGTLVQKWSGPIAYDEVDHALKGM